MGKASRRKHTVPRNVEARYAAGLCTNCGENKRRTIWCPRCSVRGMQRMHNTAARPIPTRPAYRGCDFAAYFRAVEEFLMSQEKQAA